MPLKSKRSSYHTELLCNDQTKKKESSRAEMRFEVISSLIDRTMQMLESHEILEMLRIALVCTLNTSSW
jgi:hypothetical protein